MYADVRTEALPPDSLKSLGYGGVVFVDFAVVVLVPTFVALRLAERFA